MSEFRRSFLYLQLCLLVALLNAFLIWKAFHSDQHTPAQCVAGNAGQRVDLIILEQAQRSYAIKRRKEIWEMRNPEGGKSVPTPGGEQKIGFAADTAVAAGVTKRSVNEHVARAEALGDDLLDVAGTCLDKGVELDAVKHERLVL